MLKGVSQFLCNLVRWGLSPILKKENLKLFNNVPFGTPKPESLISVVLTMATNPGDLVMDSFLGSGTTAADSSSTSWASRCWTSCLRKAAIALLGKNL